MNKIRVIVIQDLPAALSLAGTWRSTPSRRWSNCARALTVAEERDVATVLSEIRGWATTEPRSEVAVDVDVDADGYRYLWPAE